MVRFAGPRPFAVGWVTVGVPWLGSPGRGLSLLSGLPWLGLPDGGLSPWLGLPWLGLRCCGAPPSLRHLPSLRCGRWATFAVALVGDALLSGTPQPREGGTLTSRDAVFRKGAHRGASDPEGRPATAAGPMRRSTSRAIERLSDGERPRPGEPNHGEPDHRTERRRRPSDGGTLRPRWGCYWWMPRYFAKASWPSTSSCQSGRLKVAGVRRTFWTSWALPPQAARVTPLSS